MRGLLARLRAQETQHASDKGAMQLQLQRERQRAQRAEEAARRAEGQRDFRLEEVRHLKAALKRRDDVITSLEDQLRELEVDAVRAEDLQQARRECHDFQLLTRFAPLDFDRKHLYAVALPFLPHLQMKSRKPLKLWNR